MPLTHRQAFKVGFLTKCAEAGLTQEETQQLIAKVAGYGKDFVEALLGGLGWAQRAGGLGLAAGAGLGAAGGYGLARLTEPDNDPEEAKTQELISTYKQFADRAKQRAARYTYRPPSLR